MAKSGPNRRVAYGVEGRSRPFLSGSHALVSSTVVVAGEVGSALFPW